MPSLLPLKFNYTNWHGQDHEYVMTPEPALSFGAYQADDEPLTWLISGQVHSRDGELRPGRRTFQLTGMRDIELVTDA